MTVVVQDGVVGPGLAARQAPRTGSHGRLVYLSNLVITFCKILETLANGLARVQVIVSMVGQYARQFGPEPILGILLETIILIILLIRDAGAESSSFQFNHACSMKPSLPYLGSRKCCFIFVLDSWKNSLRTIASIWTSHHTRLLTRHSSCPLSTR